MSYNKDNFFPSSSHRGVSSLILFPLFATRVVDTDGAPWLANISENFRKNCNDLNLIFRGLREDACFMKKPEAKKSRDIVSLITKNTRRNLGFRRPLPQKIYMGIGNPRHNVQGQIEQGDIVMSLHCESRKGIVQCPVPTQENNFQTTLQRISLKGNF